jgi:rhodanese-related sulfurtransferase
MGEKKIILCDLCTSVVHLKEKKMLSSKSKQNLLFYLILAGLLFCLSLPCTSKAADIPQDLIERRLIHRDPSLYITPAAVMQKLQSKQHIILVDIRHKDAFETYKIPNSINIPLHFIKTKTFLKPRPTVIIHPGHNYRLLEAECRRLKQEGFNISILEGGIYAWKQTGGKLEGNRFALKTLNTLSSRTFFQEKDYDNWVVIDVSARQSKASKHILPYAKHIPVASLDEEKITKSLIALHCCGELTCDSKTKTKPFLSILIVSEDGNNYHPIERIVKNLELKNIFYLKGGIQAYAKFLEHTLLSRKSKNERMQTTSECESCKKAELNKKGSSPEQENKQRRR